MCKELLKCGLKTETMDSSETDFDIVYLFEIPNQAKNIDVS